MVVLNSFTQPTAGIRHRQDNTTVYVNDNNLGKGTLYIAESCLSWVSSSGDGFSIEYPHISLHAVSRDLSAFPQECLFLMLDTALGGEETSNGDWEDDDEEREDGSNDEGTTELRLVPDDRGMLDAMYHAMNACQALHPDPEDSFSDEDMYEDADEELPVEEADSQMARLRIESLDGTSHRSSIGDRTTGMLNTSVMESALVSSAEVTSSNAIGFVPHMTGTFHSGIQRMQVDSGDNCGPVVGDSAGRSVGNYGVAAGEPAPGSDCNNGLGQGQVESLGNYGVIVGGVEGVETSAVAVGDSQDRGGSVEQHQVAGRLGENRLLGSLREFDDSQVVGRVGAQEDDRVVGSFGDAEAERFVGRLGYAERFVGRFGDAEQVVGGNGDIEDQIGRFEDVEEEQMVGGNGDIEQQVVGRREESRPGGNSREFEIGQLGGRVGNV